MLNPILLALALVLGPQGEFPRNHVVAKPDPVKIVGKVNGATIKASDLEPYLWDWHAASVLDQLIFYRLIADEATRSGIKVTDAEVEAKMAARPEQTRQSLQGMAKSQNFILTKMEILLDGLALREFSPLQFSKVSTILIQPASEQSSALAEALKKADAAYERLQKGEAWDVVLKSSVSDPRFAANAGLIGWVPNASFPPTVQTEMKALKVGAVTKPAQTRNGIQIFRLEAGGAELKGQELAALKDRFIAAARQEVFKKLQDAAKIERLLGK